MSEMKGQKEQKEPKTRQERKKDQDTKARINGKYTTRHVRIALEKTTDNSKTSKHINKSSRTGKVNQDLLDSS